MESTIQPPVASPGIVQTPVLKNFQYYQNIITGTLADWQPEIQKIDERRKVRANRKNVEEERQKKTILSDETIIPDRTVDFNVRAQKALYTDFLQKSRRILIFNAPEDFPLELQDGRLKLETSFTEGMRYNRWKSPWFKTFDATCLHGAAYAEVVFDTSKPFNCGIEYISRGNLIYSRNLKSLQSAELILREYELTYIEIEGLSKRYNFVPEAMNTLQQTASAGTRGVGTVLLKIYKIYLKRDGIVYTSWYSPTYTNGFMAEEKKLELGIFQIDNDTLMAIITAGLPLPQSLPPATPQDITFYPIFPLRYDELEDEVILDVQGRAALDIQVQEALTHTMTATVNGAIRASQFYPTIEPTPGEPVTNKEIGPLKHGVILSRAFKLQSMPWPNPIIMTVIQALSVRNQNSMGRTDFAALTRDDTEKTATEIAAAQKQSNSLSAMQVSLLADMIVDVYNLCYLIARSQTIYGLCRRKLTTDLRLLAYDWIFTSAGDTEVMQREEKKQAFKEVWMILKDTPAAIPVLCDILRVLFPEEANTWIQALNGPKDQMLAMLSEGLAAASETMFANGLIDQQQLAQTNELVTTAQQMAGGPGNGGPRPELGAKNSGQPSTSGGPQPAAQP